MELLSASRGFLKCNFHCHTTCSDGRLSPKDVMAAYRALDYDVLAITDHREVTRPAADEIPAGLTLIPGTELDFLLPTQAVHLLGLGVSPDIADCWNPNGTPQQAIDSIRACGGRAVLAHPAWSLNTTELMCSFRGLSGVEIFNSVSSVPTNALRGDSAAMLDPVFANGQLLNCFANDDSHRYEGECGMSATMLNTNDRSVAGILRAIDEGRFYATQGPEIRELSLTDGVVHIACSPAKYIIFTAMRCGFRIAHGRWKGRPVRIMWFHRANHLYGCRLWRRMGNPHGHRQLNWGKVGRVRRCAPNLLYQLLAHCRAKWARPTSIGRRFSLGAGLFDCRGNHLQIFPRSIFLIHRIHCIITRRGKEKNRMLIDTIALVLTIIGAINWLLVGVFQFDIVAWLFGGQGAILSRILYTIIGAAGVWCITLLFKNNRST